MFWPPRHCHKGFVMPGDLLGAGADGIADGVGVQVASHYRLQDVIYVHTKQVNGQLYNKINRKFTATIKAQFLCARFLAENHNGLYILFLLPLDIIFAHNKVAFYWYMYSFLMYIWEHLFPLAIALLIPSLLPRFVQPSHLQHE